MLISTRTNGLSLLRIVGELTIANAADYKKQLLSQLEGASEVEINLSGVSKFDTAGLQLLLMGKREAARMGLVLRLSWHSRAVSEVLELSEMADYFEDLMLPGPAPA
ncbi:MAG: STAS domain-containing protein [Pseudomonadales bacterium]|nr:STAS domain-containing protein [Pseudomonadales bacterium]